MDMKVSQTELMDWLFICVEHVIKSRPEKDDPFVGMIRRIRDAAASEDLRDISVAQEEKEGLLAARFEELYGW